jgi:hypothetical protein
MMGHGVILAMTVSGVAYVAVSFVTKPSETFRLAPFFADHAKELTHANGQTTSKDMLPASVTVSKTIKGSQVYLQMDVELPVNISWQEFIQLMNSTHAHWISLCGFESIRRCTRPEILSCVSIVRGQRNSSIWLEIEGSNTIFDELQDEVTRAYHEVVSLFSSEKTKEVQFTG